MNLKKLSATLAVAASTLLLVACGSNKSSDTGSSSKGNLAAD